MSVSRALFGGGLESEGSSSSHQPRKPSTASNKSHLKRNHSVASITSLPSPNPSPMELPHHTYTRGGRKAEREVDALGPRLEPGFDHDLARGRASRNAPAFADEDLDSADEEEEDTSLGGARAANPFLPGPSGTNAQAGSSKERERRPDDPQASPTHLRRKRIDRERVQVGGRKLFGAELERTPPRGVPGKMGKGWEDDANPFIEKKGARARPMKRKESEKVAYVFRGKRITYDLPISQLLQSPESPNSDDPFHTTVPRRLFQSTPPPTSAPSTSSDPFSSSLPPSALVSPRKRPHPEDHGLPTPVQEVRKKARQTEWERKLMR